MPLLVRDTIRPDEELDRNHAGASSYALTRLWTAPAGCLSPTTANMVGFFKLLARRSQKGKFTPKIKDKSQAR
jgi:hypothetical protein